jgi:hypothetical protein
MNYLSSFAKAHNKPIAVGEWCDTYTDGVNLSKFVDWMKNNNVVAQTYWDSDDAIGATGGCDLTDAGAPARKAAYIAAFGGTSYQGTYWPTPLLALPAGNPMKY